MVQIEVEYAIQRNGEVIYEGEANVSISETDVKAIADYIMQDRKHQTAELMDIPSDIYERILNQVSDDAMNKSMGTISENDDIGLQTYLPVSLVELLPDDVIDTFPDEMFAESDAEDEDDSVQFLMDIADSFLIKGRSIAFAGTIIGGSCKVGDTVLIIDENNEVIAESSISSIKIGRTLVKDLATIADTEGQDVSILTKLQSRQQVRGAVSLIVEL